MNYASFGELLNGLQPESIDQILATRHLIDFAATTSPHYRPAFHHRLIADALAKLQRGDVTRLMILMPPRHGKSELVSRLFPAWALGKNPDEQIIACSYNDDTAKDFNRDVQRIMLSQPYAGAFPGTRLSTTNVVTRSDQNVLRNSKVFEVIGHRGSYRAAGIGGTITGKGATIGIIDDPIKNHEEAYSQTYRERVWNWYTSTFLTRGEGSFALGGDMRIAICVTPWHEDDLAGRLLRRAKEDPDADQWTVIRLPAIQDEDAPAVYDTRERNAALWPEKYTAEKLNQIRVNVGTRDWNALYQCRPQPPEGGMLKREWWGTYNEDPHDIAKRCTQVFQSWDMTFKDTKRGSFVVGQVWGVARPKFYLLAQVRARLDFVGTLDVFSTVCEMWPQSTAKLVEDKANGPAVISALKERIGGILPVQPRGSKEARAAAVSPLVESGNVYLPARAPWLEGFMDEAAAFPNGTTDDQVDAMTQALQYGHRNKRAMLEALISM